MPGPLTAIGDPQVRQAFREWLLRAADDELVIGHRHSEWTGFGPDIESDVAMSSIAQEELGHARVFYEQIAQDEGGDVDRVAFGRPPEAFRHGILLERENDGWETAIVRLVLYEPFESLRLRLLASSGQEPIAGLARALLREERYHGLFAETWLVRMAQGSEEGHDRVQRALESLWPDALGLFEATPADEVLLGSGLLAQSPAAQRAEWERTVRDALARGGVTPPDALPRIGGRSGRHTAEFLRMLDQMTEVWRSDPEARW